MENAYKRWTVRATQTMRPSDFDNEDNTMRQWC